MDRTPNVQSGARPPMDPMKDICVVPNVTLCRRSESLKGTLRLKQFHIVFEYKPPEQQRTRMVWITYPMIAFCTYRPMPAVSRQPPAIRLRCRDFTFVAFQFEDEEQAREIYERVKTLTCGVGKVERLQAFTYKPQKGSPEDRVNGWDVYDARREYKRMGISPKESDKGWRISSINHDYTYSPTYPSLLVVPTTVSDNILNHGASYRNKARIPALTYLHPVNNCSITRSSQPRVGLFAGKRNAQDERLVAACFSASPSGAAPNVSATSSGSTSSESLTATDLQSASAVHLPTRAEDGLSPPDAGPDALNHSRSNPDLSKAAKIYGAQQKNLIIDARPQLNARVNQAAGMGSENMEFYPFATKEYLGIDNIHKMRESLNKVYEALKNSDYTDLPPSQEMLAKSKWLHYIALILRGSDLVARQVGIKHSHVLIHCSDGWDRTSQISALSQICLDPYYRTLEGFVVLVEKDWLSFGHMFRHRSGHLSSEEWFEIENERVGGGNRRAESSTITGSAATTGNNFQNSLLSQARGLFNIRNDSRESLDSEADNTGGESSPQQSRSTKSHKVTKVSETSPVFHQFLDATYQLLYQYPTRFEFNERFLRRLLYQLYSCQYGTFLYDSERERVEAKVRERTTSVWSHFLARREDFLNPQYDPTIDDKIIGKERLLFPDVKKVRWWPELFGRSDEELNGTPNKPALSLPNEDNTPVVTGIEDAEIAVGPAAAGTNTDGSGSPYKSTSSLNGTERLTAGLASLGFGKGSQPPERPRTPTSNQSTNEFDLEPQSSSGTAVNNLSPQAFAREAVFQDYKR